MNDQRNDAFKFLIPIDVLEGAVKPLTPGQEIMRAQRANRHRLVLRQHCAGKPITLQRLPPEQYKALRKAYKKIRRGADPAETLTAAGFIKPLAKASDGQDQTS